MLLAFYAGMIEAETYFIPSNPERAQQAICGTVDAMNTLLIKMVNDEIGGDMIGGEEGKKIED